MNIDDPKFTAFALDELDPAERAEVAALLEKHPEAAAEMARLRALTGLMRGVLAAEPAAALTEGQRAQLQEVVAHSLPAPGKVSSIAFSSPRRSRLWLPSAIAACLFLCAGFLFYFRPERVRPVMTAGGLAPDASTGKEVPSAAPLVPAISSPSQSEVAGAPGPMPELPAAEKVKQFSEDAKFFRDQGRPDLAYKRTEQILRVDPTNADAQQLKDKLEATPSEPGARDRKQTTSHNGWQYEKDPPDVAQNDAAKESSPERAAMPRVPSSPVSSSLPKAVPAAPMVSVPRATPATTSLGVVQPSAPTRQSRIALATKAPLSPPSSGQQFAEPAETEIAPAPSKAKDPQPLQRIDQELNTEAYEAITDNPFRPVAQNPLSTFSIDVDTASYANVRRLLQQGQRPPKGAVRIEELVNYFTYRFPAPAAGEPFSVNSEVATCPWAPEHRLLRVGLQARMIPKDDRPAANLVFLIDVSGSMNEPSKLPLVKESLRLLVEQLSPNDSVAIAVYAGASGTVLEPTSDRQAILSALDRLEAGGSTNGAAGIRLAYDLATQNFAKGKSNRVILATDGDFNVGTTSQSELTDLITEKAKSGVFLTVLGFGFGNLKDATMENLADRGNGNYAYIDSLAEGRKVLVEQMAGTLVTVAKDVKLQIEFNPAQISSYRLIGYENRLLAKEDFNDDQKDAGEIGAGHTVTALYELVPAGASAPVAQPTVDPLKYQTAAPIRAESAASAEMLTLKLRWKAPQSETSILLEFPLTDTGLTWERSSRDFRWAASVASFGMLLRDSLYKGNATWATTRELAVEGAYVDPSDPADDAGMTYRQEFLGLIDRAAELFR